MILVFPDSNTLRLCLTSGVIPQAVSLQAVVAAADAGGPLWVEPTVELPRTLLDQLRKLGVQAARSYPSPGEECDNWLQVLPVSRGAEWPPPGPQTPVLFELPDLSHLPVVVGEMLRLANDRQSFRWLTDNGKPGPVLLRVVGPPYYTLLRALDREPGGAVAPVRAYIEQAPRVWVEIGCTHPLVQKIEPPSGHLLLLQPPRRWLHVTDEPFRDIYEILDFKLPQARVDWDAANLKHRLRVPLRLIESDTHEPELWVLEERAIDQLDALVRDAKESLIHRLIFAVGQLNGRTMVVLRVRPSKQPPPPLLLEAQAYSTYLKLPNLFLPAGTRLHPILRRDAIRRLLADDPALITWLAPNAEKPGSFTPQSLPDDAFRPLEDWVDYVLDHDRQALETWVQEFRFDFEPYITGEDGAPDKPRPPGVGRRRPVQTRSTPAEPPTDKAADAPRVEPSPQDEFRSEEEIIEIEVQPHTAIQAEVAELEKQFLAIEGALDAAERQRLWPELAKRYALLKSTADAALSWLHCLWEAPDSDASARRDIARHWIRSEKAFESAKSPLPIVDAILENEAPTPADTRAVAAFVVVGASSDPPLRSVAERLPKLQRFLEKHERLIGVRAAWLAHLHLARMADNDALGLARVRDRLLDRLMNDGLSPERDLPNFLRTAGHHDSERLRVVLSQLKDLHELCCRWSNDPAELSRPLIDCMFAFGFARLGETNSSQQLLRSAEELVAKRKADAQGEVGLVQSHLVAAFCHRVDQAAHGKTVTDPLPNAFRIELEKAIPLGTMPRFAMDRMLKESQILEPHEAFDPYRNNLVNSRGPLDTELAKLADILDTNQLARKIEQLLKHGVDHPPSPWERLQILCEALTVAPRVGEQFTTGLLSQVWPVIRALPNVQADPYLARTAAGNPVTTARSLIKLKIRLLQRSLLHAANYDRSEHVQELLKVFLRTLENEESAGLYEMTASVTGDCIRSLQKLRLRDEIASLLGVLDSRLLAGRSLSALQHQSSNWPERLNALMMLAAAWLDQSQFDRARPILDAARDYLLQPVLVDANSMRNLDHLQRVAVAVNYVAVLGRAPIHFALQRIVELLNRMPSFPNTRTSSAFFAELNLKFIESVVLSIVNEDSALGEGVHRWLDEDEYLIRRRIHADHRRMKELAGV